MSKYQYLPMQDYCLDVTDGTHATPKETQYGYPLVTSKNLNKGRLDLNNTYLISESDYNEINTRSKVDQNDVLISMIGTVGLVCFVDRQPEFAIKNVGLLKNKDKFHGKWLYYYLSSPEGKSSIQERLRGTTQQYIPLNEIRKLPVKVLFSTDDMRKIVNFLSSLDDKIELNSQINHNLEEQAKVLLDKVSLSEKSIKVSKIVSFVNGFAFKSSTYIKDGNYKVVTIKNVQDGKIDTAGADFVHEIPSKMKSECSLDIGDILLSLTGNVGRTGIVCEKNLLLNQRVAKIVPHKPILKAVIYFIFRRPEMKAALEVIARGTAQSNLSPVETLNVEIPFDIESLVNLTSCMNSFFEQIISNEMESQRLAQLRDALLPKLLSGEIDVSEVEV